MLVMNNEYIEHMNRAERALFWIVNLIRIEWGSRLNWKKKTLKFKNCLIGINCVSRTFQSITDTCVLRREETRITLRTVFVALEGITHETNSLLTYNLCLDHSSEMRQVNLYPIHGSLHIYCTHSLPIHAEPIELDACYVIGPVARHK